MFFGGRLLLWSAILCSAALAMMAAKPGVFDRPYQPDAAGQQSNSTQNRASGGSPPGAPHVSAKKYQSPCGETDDDRQADLCEQQRMSAAAERSANYALWQLIVGALGFGAVLLTLKLNRDAVIAAKNQVELSRNAIVASNRPWISVSPRLASDLVFEDGSGRIAIDCRIQNTGKSPALNILLKSHLIVDEGRADALLRAIFDEQTRYYPNLKITDRPMIGDVLFPNEDTTVTRRMSLDRDVINAWTGGRKDGGFPIFLVGSFSYLSSIDREVHHTGFIYDLRMPKPDDPKFCLNFGNTDGRYTLQEMVLARAFKSGFAD